MTQLLHRSFVPISAMPKSLVEAFVAAEEHVCHHSGIGIFSIVEAVSDVSTSRCWVLHSWVLPGD